MLRVLAILALAASILTSAPADAHVGNAERAAFEAPELTTVAEATGPAQFFIAGGSTDFPWPIAVMAFLAAAALVRRRSRRLVAAILVLLIAILGVEAAVHSVHHGVGGQPVTCPTASVAAHLHGTTVVALALDEPVHPVGTAAVPSELLLASFRSLDPSRPRAPPFALA
jgi:hypothetical protein